MNAHHDVVVFGAGPAGLAASMQSAAAGATTLMVERSSMLGGTTTAGGINFPGLFHAWGRQVIRGYGWQLVERCAKEIGQVLPDFSVIPDRHWHHQIPLNRAIYIMLCDEAVINAGVELLLHAMPARIDAAADGWEITLCTKTGLETLHTSFIIDCTGDANAVALAGGELRLAEAEHQPGTQACHVSGFDLKSLDFASINKAFMEHVERGELSPHDVGWNTQSPNVGAWLSKRGENANHIPSINARDSRGRTRIELAGRASVLRLYRFLRQQPGLENLTIDYLAPECGVRETATILGDVTITADDYLSGRLWDEALCYSFYPIDLHTATADGLKQIKLAPGVVPTVPRGALLPQGLPRIAAAGRCVSSDRPANSALRVQASAMAMGQAAGAMAAIAHHTGQDMRQVDIDPVRELLKEHDAIVPA